MLLGSTKTSSSTPSIMTFWQAWLSRAINEHHPGQDHNRGVEMFNGGAYVPLWFKLPDTRQNVHIALGVVLRDFCCDDGFEAFRIQNRVILISQNCHEQLIHGKQRSKSNVSCAKPSKLISSDWCGKAVRVWRLLGIAPLRWTRWTSCARLPRVSVPDRRLFQQYRIKNCNTHLMGRLVVLKRLGSMYAHTAHNVQCGITCDEIDSCDSNNSCTRRATTPTVTRSLEVWCCAMCV